MPSENIVFSHILWLSFIFPMALFFLLIVILKIFPFQKFFSKNAITALSAGLLISLTFIEFLPHSLKAGTPLSFSLTMLFTLTGLLLIETHLIPSLKILKKIFPHEAPSVECSHYHQHHHHPFSHKGSFSAIGCLLICAFFDGIRLGSAVFIDRTALQTAVTAVLLHILPEALAVMGLAQKSGLSPKHYWLLKAVFCLFLGQGILMTGFLHFLQVGEGIILSFASGTLLYVSFVHLLPVAFAKENQKWLILSLLASSVWLLMTPH